MLRYACITLFIALANAGGSNKYPSVIDLGTSVAPAVSSVVPGVGVGGINVGGVGVGPLVGLGGSVPVGGVSPDVATFRGSTFGTLATGSITSLTGGYSLPYGGNIGLSRGISIGGPGIGPIGVGGVGPIGVGGVGPIGVGGVGPIGVGVGPIGGVGSIGGVGPIGIGIGGGNLGVLGGGGIGGSVASFQGHTYGPIATGSITSNTGRVIPYGGILGLSRGYGIGPLALGLGSGVSGGVVGGPGVGGGVVGGPGVGGGAVGGPGVGGGIVGPAISPVVAAGPSISIGGPSISGPLIRKKKY